MTTAHLSVQRHLAESRFDLMLDGERVGLADYRQEGDVIAIVHVETSPAHRNQGFAAALMDGVVASLREHGQQLRPVCPYAVAYVGQHPELGELVVG